MNTNYIIKDLENTHIWAEGIHFIRKQLDMMRFFDPVIIQYRYKHWSIKLRSGFIDSDYISESRSYGGGAYTSLTASISSKEKFTLDLGTENFVTRTLKKFGRDDILTNDAAFDNEFFIRSNNEDITKGLLASDSIRQILQTLPVMPSIYTKGRKTRKKLYIHWHFDDMIDNIDLLKDLFKLFSLMLDQLKKIKVID
ncbi:MAG: hypothetical protein NE330_01285 [Lentisphaeraceae bacterium]|nr:hypothetical protein [Lentisphaeraceae bacterium]